MPAYDNILNADGALIVGAGLAGLFCALKLAPRPVTILSPKPLGFGASSAWAQGGLAAAVGKGDSPHAHAVDTEIAGAGIVVRNSIILVDFIELRRREGLALDRAVIDAGAVRFRPMALTAAAVVVGAGVILFDPIFQGLAISLMAGEVASLLLSRMAVPVLYFMAHRGEATVAVPAQQVAEEWS
mgnify:CR=1 FL=1